MSTAYCCPLCGAFHARVIVPCDPKVRWGLLQTTFGVQHPDEADAAETVSLARYLAGRGLP